MAPILPTVTIPLTPFDTTQQDIDEVSERFIIVKERFDKVYEGLDKSRKELGEILKEYESNTDRTPEAQATLLEAFSEHRDSLTKWLEFMEDVVKRYAALLEDAANIRNTLTTTDAASGTARNQENALSSLRAEYMVAVLLLGASLLTTMFALIFVSTEEGK